MKAAELLANSPYKDQLKTAQMFIAELQLRIQANTEPDQPASR